MKAIIVEDDPISRRLLETYLSEWGYDIIMAHNGEEAWKLFQNESAPNLVISDWMMPEMDGLMLCRKIRESENPAYVYFILLTSKGGNENIVEGLMAGADDYLVKPFNQNELKCRIGIGKRIIEMHRKILKLATTDSLTGVFNRKTFMEKMTIELQRSKREQTSLSMILLDIDYFKTINDGYGHQTGDLVLQRFTEQLFKSTRSYDFIGRYGGEEFVICLPNTDLVQSRSIAERMRKNTEEMEINGPGDLTSPIKVTASFGVASLSSCGKESVDSIISRADEAMYRAKREGRNRVCTARGMKITDS